MPLNIESKSHKEFLTIVLPIFSKVIFQNDNKRDYSLGNTLLKPLAYFILNLQKSEIPIYLEFFLANSSDTKEMAEFFQEFVSMEDKLYRYDEFWIVWGIFYKKIVDFSSKTNSFYGNEIIYSYLFAGTIWKKDAKEWHTLKDREKVFFKKVAKDMGHHPAVIYALSKNLDDIGSKFLEDGVSWISHIVNKNENLKSDKLLPNTIFYVESLIRRYILLNRSKIKKSFFIKQQVLYILTYLVERGSTVGYLLRDDIL